MRAGSAVLRVLARRARRAARTLPHDWTAEARVVDRRSIGAINLEALERRRGRHAHRVVQRGRRGERSEGVDPVAESRVGETSAVVAPEGIEHAVLEQAPATRPVGGEVAGHRRREVALVEDWQHRADELGPNLVIGQGAELVVRVHGQVAWGCVAPLDRLVRLEPDREAAQLLRLVPVPAQIKKDGHGQGEKWPGAAARLPWRGRAGEPARARLLPGTRAGGATHFLCFILHALYSEASSVSVRLYSFSMSERSHPGGRLKWPRTLVALGSSWCSLRRRALLLALKSSPVVVVKTTALVEKPPGCRGREAEESGGAEFSSVHGERIDVVILMHSSLDGAAPSAKTVAVLSSKVIVRPSSVTDPAWVMRRTTDPYWPVPRRRAQPSTEREMEDPVDEEVASSTVSLRKA